MAMTSNVTVVLLNSFGDRVISLPSFLSLPGLRQRKERRTLILQVPSMHYGGCTETVVVSKSAFGGSAGALASLFRAATCPRCVAPLFGFWDSGQSAFSSAINGEFLELRFLDVDFSVFRLTKL
jgi:hypothetical protein